MCVIQVGFIENMYGKQKKTAVGFKLKIKGGLCFSSVNCSKHEVRVQT